MRTIKRLVDLTTIRPNPNAGRTEYHIAGRAYEIETPGGKGLQRQVQIIHSMTPEPTWFYQFEAMGVECLTCHAQFPVEELQDDEDDYGSCAVCPRCKTWDCLGDIRWEFESIEEALKRRNRGEP